jgi:MSHA biogenesis protein MshO
MTDLVKIKTRTEQGFTLFEMVIAIALTGIVAAVVAVFIPAPVKGYFDTIRRADMANAADSALGNISREIALALPGSVRITRSGDMSILEFIPATAIGVYLSPPVILLDSAVLDVAGPPSDVHPGDRILMDTTPLNAYKDTAPRVIRSVAGKMLQISVSKPFTPLAGNPMVYIVGTPVSYVCNPAAKTIRRHWGYGFSAAQPTTFANGSAALLAQYVSACLFDYAPESATSKIGLLKTSITLTQSTASVSIYQETQINNEP